MTGAAASNREGTNWLGNQPGPNNIGSTAEFDTSVRGENFTLNSASLNGGPSQKEDGNGKTFSEMKTVKDQ